MANKISPNQNSFQARKSKPTTAKDLKKQYEKIAGGMETQFVNFMIGEMKKSVSRANPNSNARDIYESLLQREQSEAMSEQGIGIKKMILDQILPDYLKNLDKPKAKEIVTQYKKNTKDVTSLKENNYE